MRGLPAGTPTSPTHALVESGGWRGWRALPLPHRRAEAGAPIQLQGPLAGSPRRVLGLLRATSGTRRSLRCCLSWIENSSLIIFSYIKKNFKWNF